MRLTPDEEAAYSLDYGVPRADLKPQVQAAYDRLLAERKAEAAKPRAPALAGLGQPDVRGDPWARDTWLGSPLRPQWQTDWSVWLFVMGLFGVVAAFLVGAFGASDGSGATDVTAGALLLFALAALCVAVPGLVYRWRRGRRAAAMPRQPAASPFAPCYRCGYPLAVHVGEDLRCPQAGMCYRCGKPLATHSGYELTCPDAQAPHCYRCGQPYASHAGDGLICPVPPVLTS